MSKKQSVETRFGIEPIVSRDRRNATYLFSRDVCIWGDGDILKIGLKSWKDLGEKDKMITLNVTPQEAEKLSIALIQSVYQHGEDRANNYMEIVRKEAEMLDSELCEIWEDKERVFDPYDLYGHIAEISELSEEYDWVTYARNPGSDVAIMDEYIPKNKLSRIYERISEKKKHEHTEIKDEHQPVETIENLGIQTDSSEENFNW